MQCLLCGDPVEHRPTPGDVFLFRRFQTLPICARCRARIAPLEPPFCPQCHRHVETAGVCTDCRRWQARGWSPHHLAFYHYDGGFKDWLLLLKAGREQRLAALFQTELKKVCRHFHHYVWVPVPSNQTNAARRGFHQTECILHACHIPYQSLLVPPTTATKQAAKTRRERLQHAPFAVDTTQPIPEKVLLFDDVYTTGATLYAATQALERAGVTTIQTVTLAR